MPFVVTAFEFLCLYFHIVKPGVLLPWPSLLDRMLHVLAVHYVIYLHS